MKRFYWNVLEAIERIILALREFAFWLCRFEAMRPIASPVYVQLGRLYNWYWEKVL